LNDPDVRKAILAIMDSADADRLTGEIDIKLVYGQGGVRDCLYSVKKKITNS
jgi:hypothetical protein